MRHALVTGATGLVGSYLVERLLADGWRVRALVRDPARAAWLGAMGVELAAGDVLDRDRFIGAAAGCDVVFHGAATIIARGGWERYRRSNVDGTANAIVAAERGGARLLHVSSVAVYGPTARYANPGGATDERVPLAPLPGGAHYARSKRESEAMVLDAHRAGRIWAAAVRPCVVYGRRDRQFVPRVARLLRLGVAPLFGGGRTTLAVVHAASVADGAVRAATSEVAGGKAYNLANDFDVRVADFVRLAAQGMGRRLVVVPLPHLVARLGVGAVGLVARLTPLSALRFAVGSALDFLTRDNPFSSELARRELGWSPPVPPEEGIPEAFRWAVRHGA